MAGLHIPQRARDLESGGEQISGCNLELKQPQMDTLSFPLIFLSHNILFLSTISVFYNSLWSSDYIFLDVGSSSNAHNMQSY